MVSVSIPVAACVLFCGNTVDNKVAAVIAVKPPMMLSKVVLPEPLGPKTATNSLLRNSRLTLLSAF